MRGLIPGLVSPVPLADMLPALLREDELACGFCRGLDEVLAPVLLSLDSMPAYLNLATTPDDTLPWLAEWIGITLDPGSPIDRQRSLMASAGEVHVHRGTRRGIALAVEASLGVSVDVAETGASAWSDDPRAAFPGEPQPAVVVTVRPVDGQEVDLVQLDALVAAVKPAHVGHHVQIVPHRSG